MDSKKSHKRYLLAVLFALSFLLYGKTIRHEFVWDDQRSHLNAHKDLMEGNLKAIWSKPYDGMYIPLTYTTWYFLIKASSKETSLTPPAFHFLNILFHALKLLFFFFIPSRWKV
jgi:hypothetical protein